MLRRLLLAPVVAVVALLVTASPAGAHVELDPAEAAAGSTLTLTFSFHHGKDGTATTALEVLLPEGAELVDLPAVPGWTATSDPAAGTITWSGGSVADGTEAAFPAVVTLPTQPGEVLFKTVQTTEAGELAWISQDEGEGEDVQPAPRLVLTPGQASSTTSADPSTTTRATRDLPRTNLEAEERDGDGSPAPWLIGSGALALVSIAIGGTILKRRSS
jgi:periplasmic copper chaperone A